MQTQRNRVGEDRSVPAHRGGTRLLLSFLRGDGNSNHLRSCASLEGRIASSIQLQFRLLHLKPVVEGEAVL